MTNEDRLTVCERANEVRCQAVMSIRARRSEGPLPPLVAVDSSLETLTMWMQWNDPNGVYYEADACEADGYDPMTLEDAWQLLADTTVDA